MSDNTKLFISLLILIILLGLGFMKLLELFKLL